MKEKLIGFLTTNGEYLYNEEYTKNGLRILELSGDKCIETFASLTHVGFVQKITKECRVLTGEAFFIQI